MIVYPMLACGAVHTALKGIRTTVSPSMIMSGRRGRRGTGGVRERSGQPPTSLLRLEIMRLLFFLISIDKQVSAAAPTPNVAAAGIPVINHCIVAGAAAATTARRRVVAADIREQVAFVPEQRPG